MNSSTKAVILGQLNHALRDNKSAILRGPIADSLCKRHMQQSKVYLQNAIRAIEEGEQMRKYFQLSPARKRELRAKGWFTLAVEALSLIGLIALTWVTVALIGGLL